MRRRSRLPTPSNVRNNRTAQEDVPIEGARLEALRAHAKRSVAASHAAAAAPPKAPWSEAATALLSICFFVALCVMGFWLEGDLESARKRQAGDCAFEEDVAGYVWPALTLPGEGLNGWRPIVASAAAVAKRLGYGLVLPCVADSELACCVDAAAPAGPWLCGGDDEAAVPPARDVLISVVERAAPVKDLRAYLDVGALEAFVGSPVVPPRCLAAGAAPLALLDVGDDLMHARDLDVGDGEARWRALAASAGGDAQPVLVARRRRRGIFALGDWWRADPALSAAPFLAPAAALRAAPAVAAAAARFRARALGDEFARYDALLWRSELLKTAEACHACAEKLIAVAELLRAAGRHVVLVTDVAADAGRPLWRGHARVRAPPDVAEAKARALQRLLDAGVAKYDAVLDWDDRGELGLVEQQLALDADVAWAQADAATDPPFKVGIGPCGWQGRFIRTVLDARAHDGRPVRSWYDPELVLWPPS